MTVNKEKLKADIYKEIEDLLLYYNIDYIIEDDIVSTVNEIIKLCEKTMV